MSVSAHMLVNDVDRHEGFDMVKMQINGENGLDGSLELSVTDPDLVGSFQPGAAYDLSLTAQEAGTDTGTDTDTDTDTSASSSDAAADDTSADDVNSASSSASSTEETETAA